VKLCDNRYAFGGNKIIGVLDLRTNKKIWSDDTVHTKIIKDIICVENKLISGGDD
jgi:hypothetical protein